MARRRPDPKRLNDKVASFTAGDSSDQTPDDVIVVAPGSSWEEALSLAKSLAANARIVRIISEGACLRLATAAPKGVSGTEMGALLVDDLGAETLDVRNAIREFVDQVLAGALPISRASTVFYASACARVFQRYIYAHPIARTLHELFPSSVFHVVGLWAGTAFLRAWSREVGGSNAQARVAEQLKLITSTIAATVAAPLALARKRTAAGPGLGQLKDTGVRPPIWLAMIPDWARINWHVIHSFGEPLLSRGSRPGVVVIGNVNAGERSEADMSTAGEKWWTGFGPLAAEFSKGPSLQGVFPRRWGRFAQVSARSMGLSLRSLWRARRVALDVDGVQVPVGYRAVDLAKFLTVDVLRAKLAWEAVDESARTFDGEKVVFSANGSAELAAVDVALQRRGARTFHLFHGSLGDEWVGAAEHPSNVHLAWTDNDARCMKSIRDVTMVGGMPIRIRQRKRDQAPRSLLLMTSYLHRDYAGLRDFEAFEDEMLAVFQGLRDNHATRHLDLSWRPHPASNAEAVDRRFEKLRTIDVRLSRGVPLQDDIDQADILVTNMSTVFAEALFSGAPVFLHLMPMHWDSTGGDFVDPTRRFFFARDAVRLLAGHVTRGENGAGEAEVFARRMLWGPSCEPAPLDLITPTAVRGRD